MSVIPYGRGIRAFGVTLLLVAFTVPVLAQPGELGGPPFDPRQVVERARAGRGMERGPSGTENSGFDDGEFLVDTSWVLRPRGGAMSPAISFDGTNYLVVWQSGSNGIYGARVSQARAVLDHEGFLISDATDYQQYPAVSFDGTNFLVVWEDNRGGSYDIYGARVSREGAVLDPAGIPISAAADDQRYPAVSSDGANFLVTWEDYRNNPSVSDIYGARVTPQGTVLDPAGIPISTTTNDQSYPTVTFDGTDFLVVWQDGWGDPDIYGARVSQAGTVLDPAGIPISTATGDQSYPTVSFDGANSLVVWQDERFNSGAIYGARLSRAGAVLDTAGIRISALDYCQEEPAVSFDGTNFLVVWHDDRNDTNAQVIGARVSRAGAVLDPNGIPISTAAYAQYSQVVAFDGTNFLVAWEYERGNSYDIYGARVSKAGIVLDPAATPISTTANRQEYPAASFDGVNFLTVWGDRRTGFSDIYGARVSQAGTILDRTGFRISTSTSTYAEWSPAVSSDGTNALVVWQRGYDIYGARVSQAGLVLDTAGILISTTAATQQNPAVSFDGSNYLVVWEDNRGGSYDIYGARVSQAGAVLDPAGIVVSTAVNYQESPAVSFDGSNCLVVWEDNRSGYYNIYGARVSQVGTVLDPAGLAISSATYSHGSPAVSFDGSNYLVVWVENGSAWDIYGARVSRSGAVLDPNGVAISTAPGYERCPVVTFDGTNYLVAWEDNRRDTSDIYGARVTPAAGVFQKGAIVLQEKGQTCPTLAHGTGSQMLLAYQGWAGAVGSKTYDADRIWGKMDPNPGIEESPKPQAASFRPAATVVRGVLFLPPASGVKREASSVLLDISGRKVLDLRPGPNSTKGLAPGVYFAQKERRGKLQKVVIVE